MSRLIIFGSIAGFAILENCVVLVYYIVSQFQRADEDPAELLADELAHPQVAGSVKRNSRSRSRKNTASRKSGTARKF